MIMAIVLIDMRMLIDFMRRFDIRNKAFICKSKLNSCTVKPSIDLLLFYAGILANQFLQFYHIRRSTDYIYECKPCIVSKRCAHNACRCHLFILANLINRLIFIARRRIILLFVTCTIFIMLQSCHLPFHQERSSYEPASSICILIDSAKNGDKHSPFRFLVVDQDYQFQLFCQKFINSKIHPSLFSKIFIPKKENKLRNALKTLWPKTHFVSQSKSFDHQSRRDKM